MGKTYNIEKCRL